MININVLKAAQKLIKPTDISIYRFLASSTNELGHDIKSFDVPETIKANVTAVKRSSYKAMGLDYSSVYINVFGTDEINDLLRDRAADEIEYNGDRYEIMNKDDWSLLNGWSGCLAIKIS